jgi:hypothetical protein
MHRFATSAISLAIAGCRLTNTPVILACAEALKGGPEAFGRFGGIAPLFDPRRSLI